MASLDPGDGSEIYDCSVCLLYMLDRNPRSLCCLHTFCEECLLKLVKDGHICCPTCRKITQTPDDDVESLPINFILGQVKMMQVKHKSDLKENILCQVCEEHPGSFLCKDCESSFCNICKIKHEGIGKYQKHEVVKLFSHFICDKHQQVLSVMCMKCSNGLCVKCTLLDHGEHSEYFEDYWKGLRLLQNETKSLYEKVENGIERLNENYANLKSNVYETSLIKKGFQQQAIYLQTKCSETEESIKNIESGYEGHDELFKNYNSSKQLGKYAVQLVSMNKVDSDEYDICKILKVFKPAAENAIQALDKSCTIKANIPIFVPDAHFAEHITEVHPLKDGIHLMKTEKVVDIKLTEASKYNRQIGFVGNHLGCIVNTYPCHIACLDQKGQLVSKYFPHNLSVISGFAVWKKKIFLAEEYQGITILPLAHNGDKIFYRKMIEHNSKILVIHDESILISERKDQGTVTKFDLREGKTEVVLGQMNNPLYMTMIHTDAGPRYIVTLWGNHTINIYDEQFNLTSEIGGAGTEDGKLHHPIQTAVTERGTLIVADRQHDRVSHFTLDGKFINNILTPSDGMKPYGVAYKYPYLWVSPHDNSITQSLRCYRVRWD